MPIDTPHRRKSRIGPGLLLKRSVGTGGASTVPTDAGHVLFSSVQHDQDTDPLRRSQHQHSQNASTEAPPHSDQQQQQQQQRQQQQQQQQASLAPFQSIVKELDDPIDQLSFVVDQLVEKMAAVADIHAGLAHFNESFGAFLYGLKMNAENVEWTEAPTKRSFERMEQREAEAIMLQQQHEELERIRRQQIMEQERERERLRVEAERLEAERIKASLPNLHTNHSNNNSNNIIVNSNSGQDGSRQRRPGTNTNAKANGVAASRIPARSNTSAASASRVGPGGSVRKLVGKMVMKRMAERLPLRYRDEVEILLQLLYMNSF
ncbi:DASH complex subunit dam1 [Dissophora ornata]|nr:DASH complex subunit dam1 [Dissophora ornata]